MHLGIDISKKTIDCAVRLADGKFKHKKVSNDAAGFGAVSQWLKQLADVAPHVCMEATGVYFESCAEYFADEGYVVSVVNPVCIKRYGEAKFMRTKTDKADAKLIAMYCHEQSPAAWQAPAPAERVLRAYVMRLESLLSMKTQESNRLDVAREAVQSGIKEHLDWLEAEIKKLRKLIRDHIDNDPDLKNRKDLLDTIPGVGEGTIATLLAYSMHHDRFDNVRKVVAFAGLDPRIRQSGSSVSDKPMISRFGHAHLRKLLYMPAIVALHRTEWGTQFRQRLEASGKRGKLIICAMMRKLIHVTFGVLKSGKPFDPSLHGATA